MGLEFNTEHHSTVVDPPPQSIGGGYFHSKAKRKEILWFRQRKTALAGIKKRVS
jgi:hypothetical protein